jgi:NAD(P)-dependent dehydrogenase (short-subunit alcohol dehydrogenase family)
VSSGPADGKVAVVTGGASGIGLAIATRLAADGAAVAVLDLNGEAADAAAASIKTAGGDAIGLAVNVTDRPGVEAAVAAVVDQLGAPTILVNNAGLPQFGSFLKLDLDTWQRVIDVNLTGTFHCCQVVLPHMVAAEWGRIVNISSSSAQGGQQLMAAYVSSKAGVIGLTKSLALEFGRKGITVNTIPPGFIDTPMLRESEAQGQLGPGVDAAIASTPVRRIGQPEDIAAATAFLVRDDASYITGQIIGVNGGRNT